MRRITILLSVAVVLALSSMPAALAQDDQSCADFESQWAAQDHLRQDPSDPDLLDWDDDGVACENHPDYPVGSARDETLVGPAPVTTGTDGRLPLTGSGMARLWPASVALLVFGLVGLVLSWPRWPELTYQGRHVRRRR